MSRILEWCREFRDLAHCGLLQSKLAYDKYYPKTPREVYELMGGVVQKTVGQLELEIEQHEKAATVLKDAYLELLLFIAASPKKERDGKTICTFEVEEATVLKSIAYLESLGEE